MSCNDFDKKIRDLLFFTFIYFDKILNFYLQFAVDFSGFFYNINDTMISHVIFLKLI